MFPVIFFINDERFLCFYSMDELSFLLISQLHSFQSRPDL